MESPILFCAKCIESQNLTKNPIFAAQTKTHKNGNLSKKHKAIGAGGAQIHQVPRRQGDAEPPADRQRVPPHRGRENQGVRQDGGLQPRHPEEGQGAD